MLLSSRICEYKLFYKITTLKDNHFSSSFKNQYLFDIKIINDYVQVNFNTVVL